MKNEGKNIEKELTEKQKKFCKEYIFDFNGSRAARDAGYSEDTSKEIACNLLTKVNIQLYIKYLKENLAEVSGISALKVLREHEKLAFSSIAHLHNTWIERKDFDKLTEDQKACIAEISSQVKTIFEYDPELKEKKPKEVEYIKIKLHDKQKSLDSINKMLGYDAPVRVDNKHDISDEMKAYLKPFKEKKNE